MDEDALVAVARELQDQEYQAMWDNNEDVGTFWHEETWESYRQRAQAILQAQNAPLDAAAYEGVIRIISNVGATVKAERTRLNKSQGTVAFELGMGQAQLSKLESGAATPSLQTIIALLNWLAEASEQTPP